MASATVDCYEKITGSKIIDMGTLGAKFSSAVISSRSPRRGRLSGFQPVGFDGQALTNPPTQ
jgi:hypothetical protein